MGTLLAMILSGIKPAIYTFVGINLQLPQVLQIHFVAFVFEFNGINISSWDLKFLPFQFERNLTFLDFRYFTMIRLLIG